MPARFYVAKRSLIGATETPIKGKKEFELKCLKGLVGKLTNGEDYDDFATRQEALDWVANNEFPEEERVVSPSKGIPKPIMLQFAVGLGLLVLVCIGFVFLQKYYYEQCFEGFRFWNTAYNLLFSPTCRFYQQMLVSGNDWFVQLSIGFCSSFGIFLYPFFMSAWRQWTPFSDQLLAQRFENE